MSHLTALKTNWQVFATVPSLQKNAAVPSRVSVIPEFGEQSLGSQTLQPEPVQPEGTKTIVAKNLRISKILEDFFWLCRDNGGLFFRKFFTYIGFRDNSA